MGTKKTDSCDRCKDLEKAFETQERFAELGRLSGGIAHELKNPLNLVTNFAQSAHELMTDLEKEISDLSEDGQDLVDDINDNRARIAEHADRANKIVRGILSSIRGEKSAPKPINLNKLMEINTMLAYHAKRAEDPKFNVLIEKDFDESLAEGFIGHEEELGRVIINIADNAFDAVREKAAEAKEGYKPTVSIETKVKKGKVCLFVMDNGVGIDPKNHKKVFEVLFSTKPQDKGTGLGLSVSKEIVEKLHKGTIKVDSGLEWGTSVDIELPMKGAG